MTRRDFQLIADVLSDDGTPRLTDDQLRVLALRFADALAGTNQHFDRDRFMAAATTRADQE